MLRSAQRWGLGALVVGVLVAVLAELKAQTVPSDDALALKADQALSETMRSGDKSAARRLLSLQFTFVDENGKVLERKEFLAGLKRLAGEPASDVRTKIYGRIATVTGRRTSARGNEAFFLDIWAKQKGSWRALTMQNVVLGSTDALQSLQQDSLASRARDELAKLVDCKNPCQAIPYRVRSTAEQDVVNAFQATEKAILARDAGEFAKHIADEFVHYRSGYAPSSKSERIAIIKDEKERNIAALTPAVQSMRLWVYGDGAAMVSTNGAADNPQPMLRVARIWVKRNGLWQMVSSVQTEVENP